MFSVLISNSSISKSNTETSDNSVLLEIFNFNLLLREPKLVKSTLLLINGQVKCLPIFSLK